MQVRSLGWEDPLVEGMTTYCSILAWRISWTEEPGGPQPIVWQRRRHDCSDLACTRAQMNWLTEIWELPSPWSWDVSHLQCGCVHTPKGSWIHKLLGFLWRRPHIRSDQIRSVAQLCPTLCDPMNRSTPGLPVHHQLPEFTETHVRIAKPGVFYYKICKIIQKLKRERSVSVRNAFGQKPSYSGLNKQRSLFILCNKPSRAGTIAQ